MKLTTVDFSAGAEGIQALYIDGTLHKYGDDYHDRIREWIPAFTEGLHYAGLKFKEERIDLEDGNPWIEETWANGNPPPEDIKDIYKPVP